MTEILVGLDEQALIKSVRDVKLGSGHGRILIEIRDGKVQLIEKTHKIKI